MVTRSDPGVSQLTVTGGAGGTEARYEDLAAMSRLTDSVAEDTLGIAATCHKYLAEPDVVASAALDPGGAAAFEQAMLSALDGSSGLSAASAAIGLRGAALRASAETYQLTDELNAKTLDTANDFVNNHSFNVTHVITAGSPVGNIPVPSHVQMLTLENNNDIVPHLDAAENRDTPNHTTVKFGHQTESVGSNHQIAGNYQVAAQQVDTSTNPSVQRFRTSMGAFTGGSSVETHQYEVTR